MVKRQDNVPEEPAISAATAADVTAVAEICSRLQSAYRTMHLYPPGHSMIENRMQPLSSALFAFLSTHDSLSLQVEESSLTYQGELVFRQQELRDDAAFVLFREGIRRLTLYAGLDDEELRGLVTCFSSAPEAEARDEDLVTLLWEADFANVEYEVVDPLLLELSGTSSFEALKTDTRAKLDGWKDTDLSLATPGWQEYTAGEPLQVETGVLVGPKELAMVERAIAEEARPQEQLVEVLMETLVCSMSERGVEAARNALSQALVSGLQQGDLAYVLTAVSRLSALQQQHEERRAVFASILEDLARKDSLGPLVAGLDGSLKERQADVEALLPQLAPYTYPVLLDLLAGAQDRRARKCLLNVLTMDPRLPLPLVKDRLSDPRWFVVRNMVLLLGASQDRCPADYLLPALHHSDDRVRVEAVRGLDGMAAPRSSALLRSALADQSQDVRTAAARALGRRREHEALPDLLGCVTSPEFAKREPSETSGFLDAVGRMADDRALPALTRLWEDRLLRSQPMHIRLSALHALAAMGTPAAVADLERARRSRSREVRQEAERRLLGLRDGSATSQHPGG